MQKILTVDRHDFSWLKDEDLRKFISLKSAFLIIFLIFDLKIRQLFTYP